jgi:hypothetical protein
LGRAVNLVVSCSNRKRYPAAAGLSTRELSGIDIDARLDLWKKRLTSIAAEEHSAETTYIGEHWSIARAIPTEASAHGWAVRLWICSAGYGLIQPDTLIKPYQATFSPGSPDSVQILPAPRTSRQQWWTGVCTYVLPRESSSPRSLKQLASAFPRTPLVVALSADYLAAIETELQEVLAEQSFFRHHLSIISSGTRDRRHVWGKNLLPCDRRLSASLGGTLTSLNARVARHLFQFDSDANVARLAEHVQAIAPGTRTVATRTPQSDEDVERFIRGELKKTPNASRSKLLDRFRASGKACEQRRFGTVYTRLREEVRVETHA